MTDQDQEHSSSPLPSSPPVSRWLFTDPRARPATTTSSQDVFAIDTKVLKPRLPTKRPFPPANQSQSQLQSISEGEEDEVKGDGKRLEANMSQEGKTVSGVPAQKKKVLPRSKHERVAHNLASRTYRQRQKEINSINAAKALRYDAICGIALRYAECSSQKLKSDIKAIRKICEMEFGADEEGA